MDTTNIINASINYNYLTVDGISDARHTLLSLQNILIRLSNGDCTTNECLMAVRKVEGKLTDSVYNMVDDGNGEMALLNITIALTHLPAPHRQYVVK